MKNILFVCNGNVARSQEAEVFINALDQNNNVHATSGGVDVIIGKPIDPLVVAVMAEIGYDMSSAKRKFVDEAMARSADILVSFKPEEELPDFIKHHPDIKYWSVLDPRMQPVEVHRQVRDEIKMRVSSLINEIREDAT